MLSSALDQDKSPEESRMSPVGGQYETLQGVLGLASEILTLDCYIQILNTV